MYVPSFWNNVYIRMVQQTQSEFPFILKSWIRNKARFARKIEFRHAVERTTMVELFVRAEEALKRVVDDAKHDDDYKVLANQFQER